MKLRCTLVLSFALVAVAAIVATHQPETQATAVWTLLPQTEWTDEFSPLYSDGNGNYLEGDPDYDDDAAEEVFYFESFNPDTQELELQCAIRNEVLINFEASRTATQIETCLDNNDLEILSAWFDPDVTDADTSISWFHVEIQPTSPFYHNVLGMVAHLESIAGVEFAEPNMLVAPAADFPDVDPDDTKFDDQPELERLNALDAWKDVGTGTGMPSASRSSTAGSTSITTTSRARSTCTPPPTSAWAWSPRARARCGETSTIGQS